MTTGDKYDSRTTTTSGDAYDNNTNMVLIYATTGGYCNMDTPETPLLSSDTPDIKESRQQAAADLFRATANRREKRPDDILLSGPAIKMARAIYPEKTTLKEVDAEIDRVRRWKLAWAYTKRYDALVKAEQRVDKQLLKLVAVSSFTPAYKEAISDYIDAATTKYKKLTKRTYRLRKRFIRDYPDHPAPKQALDAAEITSLNPKQPSLKDVSTHPNWSTLHQPGIKHTPLTERRAMIKDDTRQLSSTDTLLAIQELTDEFSQYDIQWCCRTDGLTEIAIINRRDNLMDTPPEPKTAKMLLEEIEQALANERSVEYCLDDPQFRDRLFKLCWLMVVKD